jgi:hypothetical protein
MLSGSLLNSSPNAPMRVITHCRRYGVVWNYASFSWSIATVLNQFHNFHCAVSYYLIGTTPVACARRSALATQENMTSQHFASHEWKSVRRDFGADDIYEIIMNANLFHLFYHLIVNSSEIESDLLDFQKNVTCPHAVTSKHFDNFFFLI